MNEDQIVSRIAFVVSLIAFFGVLVVGCYAYFDEPESVDVSGITENKVLIISLQKDISNLESDIDDLDLTCNCEIDEDDFEDLEDDIKDLEEDIEDCAKDNPSNITKLTNCLKKL